MIAYFSLFYLVFIILLSLTYSADSSSSLPKNGTFIITKFNYKNCSDTASIQGFVPEAGFWKVEALDNVILQPVSFNPNISRLSYKKCEDKKNCEGDFEMFCLNECKEYGSPKIYYSCNFMPKSNLSLFTFTGFKDSGCNNNNGNIYPLPLTTACWNLSGNGSMNILSFIERRMTVNLYKSNNCLGEIAEYNKGFECDESCIDNPIDENNKKDYFRCKYTSSSSLKVRFISLILLYLVFVI